MQVIYISITFFKNSESELFYPPHLTDKEDDRLLGDLMK